MNKGGRHSFGKLVKWQSVLSSNDHRDGLLGYLFIRKLNKQSLKSKTTDESMQINRQTGAKQNQINSVFDEQKKRGEKQWRFYFCEISGLNEEFRFDPKLLNWCRKSISILDNHKSTREIISIIFLQTNLWEKSFHVRLANQQVFIDYDHWKLSDFDNMAWAYVICWQSIQL